MAVRRTEAVVRCIRRLAGPRVATVPDRELVGRFVGQHDERAFEALVRRHGPMVLRLCLRIVGNQQDAEDLLQATFLILSRKAASLNRQDSVVSWLYGVAHRLALKARTQAARKRALENHAVRRRQLDPLAEISLREAQEIMDQELLRLSEKYRAPFVLCCVEGLARDEAAQQLNWPLELVKSRLGRARELLRKRLLARGLGLSGALVATVLSALPVAAAVSTALVSATVQAATQFAAGGAASSVVSGKVAALTEGVLATMLMTKLKIATAVIVAVVALGLGGGLLCFQALAPAAASAAMAGNAVTDKAVTDKAVTDKAVTDKAVTDKDRLQGAWIVASAEFGGKPAPDDMVRTLKFVFAGDKITVHGGQENANEAKDGTYTLDSRKNPKEIDIIVDGKTTEGIFTFEKDLLKFAAREIGQGRPTEFTSPAGARNIVIVFKREQARPDQGQQAETDQEMLQGLWAIVKTVEDGKEKKGIVGGVEIVGHKLVMTSALGESECTLALDTTKTPKWVDISSAKGEKTRGIYRLQGDALTLCLVPSDKARPTEFASKPGSGHTLAVLQRLPPAKNTDEEQDKTLLRRLEELRLEQTGAKKPKGKWQPRAVLREHKEIFLNVTFSPDGKTLATVSLGGTVKLWDVARHEMRMTLKTGHRGHISLAFSPDSATLASIGDDGEAKLWDVTEGKERRAWRVIPKEDAKIVAKGAIAGGVGQLAYSPDGKFLATAWNNIVKIWDVGTGKEQATLQGHSDSIRTLAYALGGKVLITGSADQTVKVWDIATATERASIPGPADGHVALSGDGRTLAMAIAQNETVTITLWDVETAKEKVTWKDVEKAGRIRLAFSRDGQTLATERVQVRLWDVASGKELAAFKRDGANPALALAFSPDNTILAAAGYEVELPSEDFTGLLSLWELRPGGK